MLSSVTEICPHHHTVKRGTSYYNFYTWDSREHTSQLHAFCDYNLYLNSAFRLPPLAHTLHFTAVFILLLFCTLLCCVLYKLLDGYILLGINLSLHPSIHPSINPYWSVWPLGIFHPYSFCCFYVQKSCFSTLNLT